MCGVRGPACLLLLLLAPDSRAEYDIDDSLLYKIEWPGPLAPGSGLATPDGSPSGQGSAGPGEGVLEGEQVVMTSVDNEQYSCRIPRVVAASSAGAEPYTGPTVLGLLHQLFAQQPCAYRLESYWTYELCHGQHLRQYHEERDGKEIKVQEYSLGKFTKEMFDELVVESEKDLAGGITRHPPTKKIEGMNMPYHEVLMNNGDLCDLNKQPRRARVLYVCYPAGKNEVYSLKEVSSCEYEVVVLTASLCSHPDYRPKESTEHGITCRPLGDGQLRRKPIKLNQLEIDGLKLRSERMFETLEAHMSGGDGPGKVKIEIKPVQVEVEADEPAVEREGQWKATVREPFKPLMDPQVVKEFLRGDYCLYGGSGWWKYEFCYGKKVDQYHEEAGGQKTVVRLGEFHQGPHLAWLDLHPAKRPKPREARKQVSIFYSGGDICDLTGQPRKVEVKMKCKKADSPSTVSLYLLEPKTCEYVLGVESPLVCDLLPHADPDTGLFPTGILDRLDTLGALETLPAEVSQADREKLDLLKRKIEEGGLMEGEAFASAGETVAEVITSSTSKSSSTSTQESVHIANGVKTIVRKTIVDGVVVSSTSETIKLGQEVGEAPEEPNEETMDYDDGLYDEEIVGVLSDEELSDEDYLDHDIDEEGNRREEL